MAHETSLDAARDIAQGVRAAGGRALVVGGWVRDRLRGVASKDLDIEVFGIPQDNLLRVIAPYGRIEAVGQSFPVYKIIGLAPGDVDVALPRRESKTGRGHRGFEVVGDPFMTIPEAARRRDFTVNAIAWDPLTDVYEDPFDGRGDIDRHVLRVVDPRTFGDDSLRVLRAVQFAARFEFALDDETTRICRRIALDDLPAERVWGEIEKLLLQARRPSIGLELALSLGVVAKLLPELVPMVGCPQEPEWHPEGDVWVHTLMVMDRAREQLEGLTDKASQLIVMLGALCHDLGKPPTTAMIDGRIRSLGHEDAGVPPTNSLLDRLNVHSIGGVDVRFQVLGIVSHHLKPGMFHKAGHVGDGAFRRLSQKVNLELLARVARADCLGRTGTFDCSAMDWFIERARSLGVEHQPPAAIVLGRHLLDLGLKPGPRVGEILKQIYERQLDGDVKTLDDGLAIARELIAPPGT
ncbi:MAG: HD domain-containing protein [Vicinamibacterales bacterium]